MSGSFDLDEPGRALLLDSGTDEPREQGVGPMWSGLELRVGLGAHVVRMDLRRQLDDVPFRKRKAQES